MSVTNAVEKVRAFYEKDLAARIPFDKHPLKEANEYTKELYVTMLAAILQYEHEPMREQTIFLERISAGVGIESSVQEIMKRAQMMDEKFAKDFYEEFVEQPLAENFVVDALVMICCVESLKTKQFEFLCEVVDILGCTEQQFKDLILLSKAILSLEDKKILEIVSLYGSIRLIDKFEYYLLIFMKPFKTSEKELSLMIEEKEIIVFCKVKFPTKNLNKVLEKKKIVIFKDCEFNNILSPLLFSNIQGVIFDHCSIKDSSSHIFEMAHVENICIRNCVFKNIEVRGGDYTYGGLIKTSGETNLYIYESTFENISVHAEHLSPYNGLPLYLDKEIYSNAPIYIGQIKNIDIRNNQFISSKTNGLYEGEIGAQIINGKARNMNIDSDYVQQYFNDERSFSEYIKLEFNIIPYSGEKNNEMKDCTPNVLFLER